MQGVACGFLIYFACSDLIANEFLNSNDVNENDEGDHSDKKCKQRCIAVNKMIFVLMGVALILAAYTAGGSQNVVPDDNLINKIDKPI